MDETLIHSSFHPPRNFDFKIKTEIEGSMRDIYVAKRPGCELFLDRAAAHYELVIFTASLQSYADKVLDGIDPYGRIFYRLYRESCVQDGRAYVKDMSLLGRPAKTAMIVDDNPTSYKYQPEQAIPIERWLDDIQDRELLRLIPILEELADCDDVTHSLKKYFSGSPRRK